MSLLTLDHAVSLPEAEPRKKGLLARAYGALYRARMAQAERLIEQYRPLLDDLDAQARATRVRAFTIGD